MINLDLPDPTLHEFSLRADQRQTRSLSGLKELRGAVDLGEVISVPLDASLAGDDALLKHFLQKEGDGYRFHLLRLVCGFRPGKGETFDRAWLTFDLRREDGGPANRPIAWSMEPERLSRPVEISTTVKLNSKLGFSGAEVGGEIGGGEKYSRDEVFLEAYKQQQATPFWEFRTTSKVDLQGSYRLSMVVRSPAAVVTGGEVSLSVGVKQTRYLLFYEEGKLQGHPALSFSLT